MYFSYLLTFIGFKSLHQPLSELLNCIFYKMSVSLDENFLALTPRPRNETKETRRIRKDIVFSMKCRWWWFTFRSFRTYYKFSRIWSYSEGFYCSLLGLRLAPGINTECRDITETEYRKSMVIPSKPEPCSRRIIFSCRKQHSPSLAVPRIVINSFSPFPLGLLVSRCTWRQGLCITQ